MKRAGVLGLVLVMVIVATAATTWWIVGRDATATVVDSDDIVLASALQPFDDCGGLLDYFVEHALEQVGPYGLGGGDVPIMFGAAEESAAGDAAGGDAASDSSAAAPAAAEAEGNPSGTNVQEAGVDEADIVKADERVLVTVAAGDRRLRLVDLTGDTPRAAGTLELPDSWQQELFLDGDRLLVMSGATDPRFGPAGSGVAEIAPAGLTTTSSLTLVDIADLDAPRIVSTLMLDGSQVSARMIDGVARAVMHSGPVGLPFVMPEGSGLNAEREATQENQRIVEESTIDNWLPAYVLRDADGTVVDEGRLLECGNVHRPDEFAGLGLTTVLSVDVDGDFTPRGDAAVITGSDTVYASTDALYVATQTWENQGGSFSPNRTQTAIHRFRMTGNDPVVYTGSGSVEGSLLNQWAMSEHEGHLRVATTSVAEAQDTTQSSVIVLRIAEDGLAEVGRVDGLGVTERIYAVRYMGDVGYVVTFRQIDPLYVVDLSDPTSPTVEGELKIPGFSSYLHPVGDGRLVGVGQDATEEGATTGVQVSLFDVADPANPQRIDTLELGPGYSPVQNDHRAFLYWEPRNLVVLPVELHDFEELRESTEEPEMPFLGAVAITIDQDTLTEVARLDLGATETNAEPWNPVVRSQVVDGQLLTIAPGAVGYGPVDELSQRSVVRFR